MIAITIDTREQTPLHFDECFVAATRGTLRTGDYAVTGDAGFAVERKSLDDFVGTVGKGWARFQREVYRAKDAGFPSFPIIVEARLTDLLFAVSEDGASIEPPPHDHDRMTPGFVLKRIGELHQFGACVEFADGPAEAAALVYAILHARHEAINGEGEGE